MDMLFGYDVLVIDDNLGICQLAEAALRGTVPEVRYCTDPEEGLEVWARWRPRVVLIDYEMPRMNGVFCANVIRSLEGEAGLRTIMLMVTAHATPEVVKEAVAAGFNGFIHKPLSAEDVLTRVRAAVEHEWDEGIAPDPRKKKRAAGA
jgi:CheY-like chemotaxis protein